MALEEFLCMSLWLTAFVFPLKVELGSIDMGVLSKGKGRKHRKVYWLLYSVAYVHKV